MSKIHYLCGCEARARSNGFSLSYPPVCAEHKQPIDRQTTGLNHTGFKRPKVQRPEKFVQAYLNIRCNQEGWYFLRIPDLLYRLLSPFDIRLKPYEKKALKQIFAGLPDNDIKIPLTDKLYLGCAVECKSAVGKQHGRQKVFAKMLPVSVVRSQEDIEAIIKTVKQELARYANM